MNDNAMHVWTRRSGCFGNYTHRTRQALAGAPAGVTRNAGEGVGGWGGVPGTAAVAHHGSAAHGQWPGAFQEVIRPRCPAGQPPAQGVQSLKESRSRGDAHPSNMSSGHHTWQYGD